MIKIACQAIGTNPVKRTTIRTNEINGLIRILRSDQTGEFTCNIGIGKKVQIVKGEVSGEKAVTIAADDGSGFKISVRGRSYRQLAGPT